MFLGHGRRRRRPAVATAGHRQAVPLPCGRMLSTA